MKGPGLHPDGRTLGWIAAGGLTSALFFFSSVIVPIVGSFLGILAPLPLIVASLRKGWLIGALASIAAALVVGIALKPIVALYFFVQFAMLGLISSYFIEKRASFGFTMLVSSLAVAAGFFLLIQFQASSLHQGFFETLKKPVQENIHMALQNYPGLTGTEQRDMQAMFRKMLSLLIVLVPVLLIIGSWLILMVNVYLIDRINLVPGRAILRDFALNTWRVPDHFIWLVIVPGFAVFFLHGSARIVALNLLIAALTVYFFQGLCIVNFYLAKKNVSPFVKAMVYFVLFVMQIVAVMVVILGLLDMWMDFRKIFHKRPKPDATDEDSPPDGDNL